MGIVAPVPAVVPVVAVASRRLGQHKPKRATEQSQLEHLRFWPEQAQARRRWAAQAGAAVQGLALTTWREQTQQSLAVAYLRGSPYGRQILLSRGR